MWAFAVQFIKQSADKIILLAGAFFFLLSFCDIRRQTGQWSFQLVQSPNWILLLVGLILLGFFVWRNRVPSLGSASASRIENGFRLQFDSNHVIKVVFGEIQEVPASKYAAVVLPANTAFDDQCIQDPRSALGSFFLKHFPSAIPVLHKEIRTAVAAACGKSLSDFTESVPGTTVFLEHPMGTGYNLMLTGVTIIDPERGIIADTTSLLSSVKQVFAEASRHRLSSIFMPVMGSGHGGLDFKAALSLLLVQTIHSMQYEGGHNVRTVTVVVYDPDKTKHDLVKGIVDSVALLSRA